MKNKKIKAVSCDARNVSEDSLAGFDKVSINAATLILGEHAKELFNKYPVTLNTATTIEVPDDKDIVYKTVNGKHEIEPEADGTDVLLIVNGKLTISNDSKEAVKTFYKIIVNGKVLLPKSLKGSLSNMIVNGKADYYPDGAVILKNYTEIDDIFVLRASSTFYYCPGTLFFLDQTIDADKLISNGIRFSAKSVVIAESLLSKLVLLFDEETDIVRVPDGTNLIDDDLDLMPKTIKKYGTKLYVCGDISIEDAESLASLEYLFTEGNVTLRKDLEDSFDKINSVYDELVIIDPDIEYVIGHSKAYVGATMLNNKPKGVIVEDCAKVQLSEELTSEDILNKLKISDCALVACAKKQEEAVHMIATDVARIRATDGEGGNEKENEISSDTQIINTVDYIM